MLRTCSICLLSITCYLSAYFECLGVWAGLGFELMASFLDSRHCATRATLPDHAAQVLLEVGSPKTLSELASKLDPPSLTLSRS
jgi:hypothetical protein